MNFKTNESQRKLNGCYFTPYWIAKYISRWALASNPKSILEPSCGDGVFFDAIRDLGASDVHLQGFDIDSSLTQICSEKLSNMPNPSNIINLDFIEWAVDNLQSSPKFDVIVGNPPFIRYQYLEPSMQNNSQALFSKLNLKFSKHTNAWIPFVLASVELLKNGGRLGMIVPSEILHVLYTEELRKYLLDHCSKVLLIDTDDLWFENTLQGAMILLAEKKSTQSEATCGVSIVKTSGTSFAYEDANKLFMSSEYVNGEFLQKKWTYALLNSEERHVFAKVCSYDKVSPFVEIASVDVGIVTGANDFFLVNDGVVEKYGLQEVARPMFGRSEHCPGIVYDEEQHLKNSKSKIPTNFLQFDSSSGEKYREYIRLGESIGLPERYKCRIRKTWYEVPSVYASPLSMLKRSNGMPRLILNTLNAYTTDTAYRIIPDKGIHPDSLVKCFLNSLTALSAELEGRHYGGGVLELVPSEIERLVIPYVTNDFIPLSELNHCVTHESVEVVLQKQDERLFPIIGISKEEANILSNALHKLTRRRQRVKS